MEHSTVLPEKGESTMLESVKVVGTKLTIVMNLQEPAPSASGKTLVVASTKGNIRTGVEVNGKPLTLGVNAYIAK